MSAGAPVGTACSAHAQSPGATLQTKTKAVIPESTECSRYQLVHRGLLH